MLVISQRHCFVTRTLKSGIEYCLSKNREFSLSTDIMYTPAEPINTIPGERVPGNCNQWPHIRETWPKVVEGWHMRTVKLSCTSSPEALSRIVQIPDVQVSHLWTFRSRQSTNMTLEHRPGTPWTRLKNEGFNQLSWCCDANPGIKVVISRVNNLICWRRDFLDDSHPVGCNLPPIPTLLIYHIKSNTYNMAIWQYGNTAESTSSENSDSFSDKAT